MKLKTIFQNKDLDVYLLNRLDDETLFEFLNINSYYRKLCNENFFRIRTQIFYPETIKYKDDINNSCNTWRKYYMTNVKYINLLMLKYRYVYTKRDESPILLYKSRFDIPSYVVYNSLSALMYVKSLAVIKYLHNTGADIHFYDEFVLRANTGYSSHSESVSIIKYLLLNNTDIHICNDICITSAINNDNLEIIKLLIEHDKKGFDIAHLQFLAEKRKCCAEIINYLKSLC